MAKAVSDRVAAALRLRAEMTNTAYCILSDNEKYHPYGLVTMDLYAIISELMMADSIIRTIHVETRRSIEFADEFARQGIVSPQLCLWLSDSTIEDVSMFGSVRELHLVRCLSVTDVRCLADVYKLDLRGTNVEDVSCLGNVNTLDLTNCKRVRDVSQLGSVKTLCLARCPLVEDVSRLGAVDTLSLENCTGIRDVGMLGGVAWLNLRGCRVENKSSLGRLTNAVICRCVVDYCPNGSVVDVPATCSLCS